MRRNGKDQRREELPIINNHCDSPAILNLIEQLERDLKESEDTASQAH